MHGPQHDLLRMADWGLWLTFPDHPILQGMSHGGCVGPKLRKTATRSTKGHCRGRLSRIVVWSIHLDWRLMRRRKRKRIGIDHHLRRVSLPRLRGEKLNVEALLIYYHYRLVKLDFYLQALALLGRRFARKDTCPSLRCIFRSFVGFLFELNIFWNRLIIKATTCPSRRRILLLVLVPSGNRVLCESSLKVGGDVWFCRSNDLPWLLTSPSGVQVVHYCHWFKRMLLVLLHAASSARGNSCRSKGGREVEVWIFRPISHVKVSYTCRSRADSRRLRYRILFAFIAWWGALVIKYHWLEALDLFTATIKVIIIISLSLWRRGPLRKVILRCLKNQGGFLYVDLGMRGFNAFE